VIAVLKSREEMTMKPRTWMWMPVVSLFVALAMPIGMAAQDNPSQTNKPKHHTYKLIDLGTFGGPNSFFFSAPVGDNINNHGTVVGAADTSAQDPYYPNCDTRDCLILRAFQWKNGILTDLGTLPHGYSSSAGWVNDAGMILGESETGDIDPISGLPVNLAVVWKQGQINSLGTLGGSFSFGNAMNNRGQVVGLALNAISDPFSYLGLGTQTRAFLWDKGVMRDLGTLGGPDSWAASINESGQVAGWAFTNSTPNLVTGIPTQHPFLWKDGTMRDLGTLGGTFGVVGTRNGGSGGGLNNRGQVVGTMNLAGDLTHHPFLWNRGVLTDLGTLGGTNGEAYWINNAGEIVGRADLTGTTNHHAVLWKNGRITDLGVAAGWPCSTALDINAGGQIIIDTGICGVGGGPGLLWENGGPSVDLNALVEPGATITVGDVNYINDRGEIAVTGTLPNGDQHAVLLVPNGICDGTCEAEIAASQNSSTSAPNVATMTQASESSVSPANQLRNRFGQRYHPSSQPTAQRN
jgi:probable HAF family extracellular repeat protein